jgi:hypothetical protein
MATPIVFPSDLRSLSGDQSYPQIEFTVMEDKVGGNSFTSIYLPMPAGVNFSDGGTYSELFLGDIAGGGGLEALSGAMEGDIGGVVQGLGNTLKQQVSSIKPRIKAAAAKSLLASAGVTEEMAMFAQKKIKAPNQNTTFTGNKLRTFSFSFKLIARSEEDTRTIDTMQRTFRRYTYAGSSDDAPNVVLDYPPLWQIKFLLGDRENPFLPKIFACYLETFDCSFKETRTLTRKDIDLLSANISDRGIDPKTGMATSSIPKGIQVPSMVPSATVESGRNGNVNAPNNSSGQFPG